MQTENGFLRVRDPRQRALLRILAFTASHPHAAAPLVEQLANEYRGDESTILRQVATLLASGTPVVHALGQVEGSVDDTTLLALRLAADTGTLAETYKLFLREDSDARFQLEDPLYSPATQLFRRATGILIACLVLTFLGMFIVPTIVKMLDEFGLQMPAITELTFAIYQDYGYLLILFSVVSIAWIVIYSLRLRNWQWKPWKAIYIAQPATVQLRALLALAAGSGEPIETAFERLTRFQTSFALRNQLAAARERIRSGEDPWSALARQKLLRRREAQALSLAPDSATQQWLLQQAAVASAHRQEIRQGILLQSVSFFLLVLLATAVGLTAVSFFMVLCELITGLA